MPANPAHPVLDIETLRKRHRALETQKTTEEANLANAKSQLEDLKLEALQKYETDDLDALRLKLGQMQAENERKLQEYQAHLAQIQEKLEEVKRQFAADVPGMG